ncbi:phosphatidylethanolamine-binding protein 4-like [Babylonia areolata]|uniref:phosphatidylethanolamine-binding protein 4-like n=1 Tax=Babylonia areolata TaxID=304850 RepID=UPI003FD1A085
MQTLKLALLTLALTLTVTQPTQSLPGQEEVDEYGEDCHPSRSCTTGFEVWFPEPGKKDEKLGCEVRVKPDVAKLEPGLILSNNADGKSERMLVMMVDPDAPSKIRCVYWLHWLSMATVQKGGKVILDDNPIVSYQGPTPPRGTGVHRYQLLLFSLEKDVDVNLVPARGGFHLQNYLNIQDVATTPDISFVFSSQHDGEEE